MSLNKLMNAHSDDSSFAMTYENGIMSQHENIYLANPRKGLELCAKLISENNRNDIFHNILDELKDIIETSFLPLSERDENPTGAKAYTQLIQLHKSLGQASAFPYLEQYYTVAVGGMFSAGKSAFLNSVLGCDSLLPTDTTPTTSIPTYINKGEKDSISVLNYYQQRALIDEDALKAICHAFTEEYNVSFSHILQLISIERKDFKYPQLTFLDTPGYSKSDIGSVASDKNIAREHLRNTDYLIWLVDCQNGTIPVTDIKFIQQLELESPVLYVISKAEKKTKIDINNIINKAKTDLKQNDMAFIDVIGYSSFENQEFSDKKNVLQSFFTKISSGRAGSLFTWHAEKIFKEYADFYSSEESLHKSSLEMLNALVLDDIITGENKKHLNNILHRVKKQVNSLKLNRQKLDSIKNEFKDKIEALCSEINVKLVDRPFASIEQASSKKNNKSQTSTYRFDAIFNGDQSKLNSFDNFKEVDAEISKISSMGITVSVIDGVDAFVTKFALQKEIGNLDIQAFFAYNKDVKIQITAHNKCVVLYECDI